MNNEDITIEEALKMVVDKYGEGETVKILRFIKQSRDDYIRQCLERDEDDGK